MASNLPLEHIVASSSVSHTSGTTLITSDRPHAAVLVKIMPTLLRGEYSVPQYITRPAPESMTPEALELTDPESQSINDQQVINTGPKLDTTPRPHPLSHDTSPSSEIIPTNPNEHHSAATTADGPEEAALDRPKRSWMWLAALIFVVLSLIMLPGLIVGIVTNQVGWSIAISGAFAPAVVFFGGLFYHHNK